MATMVLMKTSNKSFQPNILKDQRLLERFDILYFIYLSNPNIFSKNLFLSSQENPSGTMKKKSMIIIIIMLAQHQIQPKITNGRTQPSKQASSNKPADYCMEPTSLWLSIFHQQMNCSLGFWLFIFIFFHSHCILGPHNP